MDQTTIDKLYEDFEISIKPGQGFKYVRTRDILDRLNKTFAGNWGVQVKYHDMVDDEVLVLVSVNLYDDDGRIKATQEGFGSAKKFRNTELGNIYKSATSKAVKSAVRNWGVALFLDEDTGSTTSSAVGNASSSVPTTSNMPQSTPSSTPSMTNTPPNVPNVATNEPPKTSVPESTPTQASNMPGPPSVPPVPEGLTSSVPKPPADTPPSGSLPTMSAVPGSAPAPSGPGDTKHKITSVQVVAITSRLGAKGLTFEQITEEFYATRDTEAPDEIAEMTYADALDLVAFLNTK